MNKPMDCQTAQEQLQDLLDQRWTGTLPEPLREHLSVCSPCQTWQVLFSNASSSGINVPAGFSNRVLARYTRDQRRQRWFRVTSYLAMAASLLIAVLTWIITRPANNTTQPLRHQELAMGKSRELFETMRQDYFDIQTRVVSQFPTPSFPDIPNSLRTAMEFPDLDDPFSIGTPAIRNISTTFQGAIEPYEAPARAAYGKVKSMIEAPEVKKLVEKVKQRWT